MVEEAAGTCMRAQILFGGGNECVGLLAAGLLAFAIAPLSRLADRLEERAGAATTPASTEERAAAAYRNALRVGLRDRRILDALRARLALAAEDASALERAALPAPQEARA